MGIPAGVLQVQRCEQDLNVPQYCQVSHSLANVTRTISFVNNFGSVNVFVSVVKEDFDWPCLSQDYKDEIEISELVQFFNKRFCRKTGA